MISVDEIVMGVKRGSEVNIHGSIWVRMYGPGVVMFYLKQDPIGLTISATGEVNNMAPGIANFLEMYSSAADDVALNIRARANSIRGLASDYREQK